MQIAPILVEMIEGSTRQIVAADGIRRQLAEEGILLEDTPQGVRWRRA